LEEPKISTASPLASLEEFEVGSSTKLSYRGSNSTALYSIKYYRAFLEKFFPQLEIEHFKRKGMNSRLKKKIQNGSKKNCIFAATGILLIREISVNS
jgi:hypothetical protein